MAFEFSHWFHLVLVYHGPNNGEGITVHLNSESGRKTTIDPSSNPIPHSTGEVVIGKLLVNTDSTYGNVMVDELTFWNRKLSETEVEALKKKYEM